MFGICVAVKATTSVSSRARKATLKSWKSRPAAPATSTRLRRLMMNREYAGLADGRRAERVRVSVDGPVSAGAERADRTRVRGIAAVRGDRHLLRLGDAPAARRPLLPPGRRGAEPRHDHRPVPARLGRAGGHPG